jgi:transcriptional repressor NrdR
MRCPGCASTDDKVVDSRNAEEGAAIRRRRECTRCGCRFTTYERIEELPLQVRKRSGERQPFEREKIVVGLRAAAKNRPISEIQLQALALEVEESVRLVGSEVTTQRVGRSVLAGLRHLDGVAYLRFASVYKGFDDISDFEREAGLLADGFEQPPDDLDKATTPKGRSV